MDVTFLGGVRTVTGSATLLTKGTLAWLVDCGMFQGSKEVEERNHTIRHHHPADLSFVLLTHAHIDHSGLIPKLVKEGFEGKILCTKATRDLCEVMLRDSAHIQEMEAEWRDRKNRRSGRDGEGPLYTLKDAEKSLKQFQPIQYDEILPLTDGLKVRFQDAGHILGSAIVETWVEEGGQERKLVFSGDLGQANRPIVRDPAWIEDGDILWIESTYGDRLHKVRDKTLQEFLTVIQDAIRYQAKVIIPAFAVERTQDVIYTINEFIRKGLIPSLPVYIDSPLAISATEIFKKNPECFDQEARNLLLEGDDPLNPPEMIYSQTTEESKAINEDSRAAIIISASGMCDAGRIKHHLKHHLWRAESHIVIIGYQAEGTLGRRIVDGAKTVRLFGEEIAVKAHIHTLGGFSAHADQKGLLEWVSHFNNPDLKCFVVHGEEKASIEFGRVIRERLHLETVVPQWQERRQLFVPESEAVRPRAKKEEPMPSLERSSSALIEFERSYRRLRKKLRKVKAKEMAGMRTPWPGRLQIIREEMDELEKALE